MKNPYRTRKVILDHLNVGESRLESKGLNEGSSLRFNHARVLMRNQSRQDVAPRGSEINMIPEEHGEEVNYRTAYEPVH